MAQKKKTEKKDVKVKDLAPKKDAKGGASLARPSADGRISMNKGGQNLDGSSRLS